VEELLESSIPYFSILNVSIGVSAGKVELLDRPMPLLKHT
jgi:hypothetical protein